MNLLSLLIRHWCWSDKGHLHLDGWSVLQTKARVGGDIPGVRQWDGYFCYVSRTEECYEGDRLAPRSAGSDWGSLHDLHPR